LTTDQFARGNGCLIGVFCNQNPRIGPLVLGLNVERKRELAQVA